MTPEQLKLASELKSLIETGGPNRDVLIWTDVLIGKLGGSADLQTMNANHIAPYVLALVVLQMGKP